MRKEQQEWTDAAKMTRIFLYLFFYFWKDGNVMVANYLSTVKVCKKYLITSISDLEQRLDHFRILFAYHWGKIENDEITYYDTREIFENGNVIKLSKRHLDTRDFNFLLLPWKSS